MRKRLTDSFTDVLVQGNLSQTILSHSNSFSIEKEKKTRLATVPLTLIYIVGVILIMNTPRMRTIPQAYLEIKKIDPDTALTLRALRRMVKNKEIPTVNVASKKLINLDLLLDKLSCYNDNAIRVL